MNLRVGTTGDYRPFTTLDKTSGEYSGFDIDMAHRSRKALGVRVEFRRPRAGATLAKDLAAGDFDIAMGGVSVTLDRAEDRLLLRALPARRQDPDRALRGSGRSFRRWRRSTARASRCIANPGGTNERFDRARLRGGRHRRLSGQSDDFRRSWPTGDADLMITDASETRYQQKLHPGVLCAIHPDQPFDFAEKAYWMAPDPALKAFVDQWLHLAKEDGDFDARLRQVVSLMARHRAGRPTSPQK